MRGCDCVTGHAMHCAGFLSAAVALACWRCASGGGGGNLWASGAAAPICYFFGTAHDDNSLTTHTRVCTPCARARVHCGHFGWALQTWSLSMRSTMQWSQRIDSTSPYPSGVMGPPRKTTSLRPEVTTKSFRQLGSRSPLGYGNAVGAHRCTAAAAGGGGGAAALREVRPARGHTRRSLDPPQRRECQPATSGEDGRAPLPERWARRAMARRGLMSGR